MIKAHLCLLSLCACGGFSCTSAKAQPPKVDDVIRQAQQADAKIQSGSLQLLETTTHSRQTRKGIESAVGVDAGPILKGALQIESETPSETNGKRSILFDNRRNALRIEYSDNRQVTLLRVYLDDKVTKSLTVNKNVTDPRYPYVPNFRTAGPMPRWNDYNLLLSSRFWQNLDTRKAKVRRGKDNLLVVELPPRYGSKQFVELDPHRGYAITRVTSIDLKRQRTRFEVRATRVLRDGIWYPSALTQIQYDVNAPVDKKVVDTTVTEVQSVTLNRPVLKSDLAIGDIPAETHVTDGRFGHTLDYQQGTKQFTDAELQKLSADPDKLRRAAAETSIAYVKAQQTQTSMQTKRTVTTAFVGLSAGVFLILAGRRVLRRSISA